ncbi:MAG: hypothetical protein AMXMBFR8_21920 [Nevskiales bacterium]
MRIQQELQHRIRQPPGRIAGKIRLEIAAQAELERMIATHAAGRRPATSRRRGLRRDCQRPRGNSETDYITPVDCFTGHQRFRLSLVMNFLRRAQAGDDPLRSGWTARGRFPGTGS